MAGRHGRGTDLVKVDELERLRRELVEWRQRHKAPTAIPAQLWTMAVELAKRNGVGPTARTLRLDYGSLKRRMNSGAAGPTPTEFIELLSPAPARIAECAMEVESCRGSRMRVVMKDVTPLGLASIIRDFAG